MKYYIIAGEASGDLHGSYLIRAIHARDPAAEIRCWGGDLMQAAGSTLVKHYRDLAFMGFVEVIKHLGTILANLRFCKKDITDFQPDIVILIDYPGFNLRIARWAKKQQFKTAYYISPQIWAWKESRIHQIKKDIDTMMVILPFEVDFYRRHNYPVHFVGHPLKEVVEDATSKPLTEKISDKPVIALIPGSRKQEIQAKLPVMLDMVNLFPHYQFVIAGAPAMDDTVYLPYMQNQNVRLVRNQTYNLLRQASAALVTSGTATLETALFKVPQVVCYRANPISYKLAKWLIKVKYISLVNLIMDKPVVTELIQDDLNPSRLANELHAILDDDKTRVAMQKDYTDLGKLLGEFKASERAADLILALIRPGH